MGKIYIIDVTNRDGVQTAKLGLSKLEKTMLNIYLNIAVKIQLLQVQMQFLFIMMVQRFLHYLVQNAEHIVKLFIPLVL